MDYQIRWGHSRWRASIDGGLTWKNLMADNEEDSSEAIEEAAENFGIPTNQWELFDDS